MKHAPVGHALQIEFSAKQGETLSRLFRLRRAAAQGLKGAKGRMAHGVLCCTLQTVILLMAEQQQHLRCRRNSFVDLFGYVGCLEAGGEGSYERGIVIW